MEKPNQTEWALAEKRFEKQLRRRYRKEKKAQRKQSISWNSAASRVLEMLYKSSSVAPRVKKGYLNLNIPETFSFIEDPEEALRIVCSFAAATRQHKFLKEICFDHSKMRNFDLAAEAVLDLAADEYTREKRLSRKKPRHSGRFPTDRNIERFIRGVGIINALHVTHEMLKPEEKEKVRIFRARNRGLDIFGRPEKKNYKGEIAAKFVDHINACLNDHNRKLTLEAVQQLSEYTGEIIGNAEDHAEIIDWNVVGYLDNQIGPHMCEIAIFNFGKTIAETFLALPTQCYAFKQIEPYLTAHTKKGLFGAHWTKEDLLTLIALQGHISSKNTSDKDTRGQGTVELIEFFQTIHRECVQGDDPVHARMAILSGNTHIMFDGTYHMASDNLGRKRIAFNKENDLERLPDRRNVKHILDFFFPGTIISIRFPMQQGQIQKL